MPQAPIRWSPCSDISRTLTKASSSSLLYCREKRLYMVCQESSTKSQVSAIMSNINLVQLSNLQSVPVNVYSVSHTLILYYSWGEACGWHFIWISHTMCSSQKREQNDPPDPVQSLPQDQRQAGRYQQHPSAKYSVSRTHGHYVLICPFVKKYIKRTLYKRYKSNKKMKIQMYV